MALSGLAYGAQLRGSLRGLRVLTIGRILGINVPPVRGGVVEEHREV